MSEFPREAYERAVLLFNPTSTNAAEVEAEQALVKDLGLYSVPRQTERDAEDMSASLLEIVQPGDLVIAYGGDQTAATAAEALIHVRKKIPELILPMALQPRGNANDSFNTHNGDSSLEEIIFGGREVDLRPMYATVERGGAVQMRKMATSYLSFGRMPFAAHEVDKLRTATDPFVRWWLEGKQRRKVYEGAVCLRAVVNKPGFTIWDEGADAPQRIGDRLYAKGPIMAKNGKFNARLEEPEIEQVTLPAAGYLGSAYRMGQLALKRLPSTMLREEDGRAPSVKSFVAARRDEDGNPETLLMQFNGDVCEIPDASTVTVSLAPETDFYRVLATRLRPRREAA